MRRFLVSVVAMLMIQLVHGQDIYNSSGRPGGYRQKKQKGYDPDRLIIGGGMNLAAGGGYANIGISPKVGYRFTDFLSAGIGVGYTYYQAPYYTVAGDRLTASANVIYPAIWAKCIVYKPFYIATDVESLLMFLNDYQSRFDVNLSQFVYDKVKKNLIVPAALVGAGVRQELGGRVTGTFEILYDVVQNENSPYYKTFVYRAGIFVGF